MVDKKEVSAQLKETADLLEVLGEDQFRARAYQNVARSVDAYAGDFQLLVREERLTELRGVGAGLATELLELTRGGMLPLLAELRDRVPAGVRDLFSVSGLGPKRVGLLWRSGIEDLVALVEAGESGRLAQLPGLGKKSAEKILTAARFVLAARRRMRLDEAERLAQALLDLLAQRLPGAQVAATGEYRRGLETVGELELLVSGAPAGGLAEVAAGALDPVGEGGLAGEIAGRSVRFTPVAAEQFGAVLAWSTGSEEYRRGLEAAATERGWLLGPDGLSGPGAPGASTEADLFGALGLPPVEPELREEAGAQPVPGLLRQGEVRGLVHNHTSWSDASFSIREMALAARELGYSYLAIADHSRSSYWADGLSIERVRAQAEEVREVRAELAGTGFELLHGIEVDIMPDGSLDYPDEVLAELDYTVVSVHQQFTLGLEEQTERLVRAVRHPHATILGHPTGRLLLRRPGYEVDLERVLVACAEAGTVVEINANPWRLDLDWRWVRRGKQLGCRFSINPDAHHTDGYDDVRYGVIMARKAGLTAADVVNTAPTGAEFLARLKRPA